MGIAPLIFTGITDFSDDFQTIMNRAVAIANVPLLDLQNEQSDVLVKKQLLTDLRTEVADLGAAVLGLGKTGATKALSASSTNTARVTISLNGATQPGTYTVSDITSVAKAASETSTTGYATDDSDAVSTDGTMELVVGTDTYVVDVTGAGENDLQGVRDAINALDAGVSAAILNTGTGGTPYYLSITSNATGATTLELRETAGEAGTNVLSATNQGADAVFKLNGLDVTKSDNVINDVVSGVTFTIQSKTDVAETVDLTLSTNRGDLATKLASLVTAYNDVKTQTDLQIGEAAGLLSGDYIVREVQQQLRELASYESAASTMNNLTDLGIEFDDLGVMTFDTDHFYSISDADIAKGFDFLGTETTGLGALSDNFEQISDPITGLIKTQQDQYDITDDRLTDQILILGERIDLMQTTLSAKLQQADVLVAQLEAQQTLLQGNIDSLNLALFGKNDG